MENINTNLQKFRELKELTQTELAIKSKVSQTYISEIENGKKNPTIPIVRRLAYALGVSIFDLIGSDDKENDDKEKNSFNYT